MTQLAEESGKRRISPCDEVTLGDAVFRKSLYEDDLIVRYHRYLSKIRYPY
jgi:hypothetical protein